MRMLNKRQLREKTSLSPQTTKRLEDKGDHPLRVQITPSRVGWPEDEVDTVWSKLTPRHNKFIETILRADAHMICCGRSKQDYAINQTEKNGKVVNIPEKIGLKAVTREGFDYEMTVAFDLLVSHYANSTKDRTGLFQDKPEHIISEETGQKLKAWNDSGYEVPIDVIGLKAKVMHNFKRLGFGAILLDKATAQEKVADVIQVLTGIDSQDEKNLPAIVKALEKLQDAEGAQATYGMELEERAKKASVDTTNQEAAAA